MSYLELCPACQRLAHELVEEALDFTAVVTRGEFPRICEQHLPLVFSVLGYPTMATWLDHMLSLRETDRVAFDALRCPLCEIEACFAVSDRETASAFLCPTHGGGRPDTLSIIRHHLARIVAGERFDQQRFVIRAALLFYIAGRGTTPFVRIE